MCINTFQNVSSYLILEDAALTADSDTLIMNPHQCWLVSVFGKCCVFWKLVKHASLKVHQCDETEQFFLSFFFGSVVIFRYTHDSAQPRLMINISLVVNNYFKIFCLRCLRTQG